MDGRRTLAQYFEHGLTPEAFETLLTEDQCKLHRHHLRRAEIDEAAIEALRAAGELRVLIITEPWCGDSLAIFPIVVTLFGRAGHPVRVVRRDEHPELIDRYLTRGGRAIPIVVVLDERFAEVVRWGPRPAPAQEIVEDQREAVKKGRVDRAEVHKQVRAFYGADRGRTIVKELAGSLRRPSK